MEVRAASAARNAGDYERALKLYRIVPAHERTTAARESYRCLLELTTSRRVIGDLMKQLDWEPSQYHGFEHLDPIALQRADTAELRKAFVALGADTGSRALENASIADELIDGRDPEGGTFKELEGLGISLTGGVRLAVARTHLRAGQLDAAIEHLRAAVREAPSQVAAWSDLASALTRHGLNAEAATCAYFATQLLRNRPNLYAGYGEAILRYCGYEIFFNDGMFQAYPSKSDSDARRGVGFLGESNSRIQKTWRTLQGFFRSSMANFTSQGVPRTVGVKNRALHAKPDDLRSEDLLELTELLDRLVFERQVRRSYY